MGLAPIVMLMGFLDVLRVAPALVVVVVVVLGALGKLDEVEGADVETGVDEEIEEEATETKGGEGAVDVEVVAALKELPTPAVLLSLSRTTQTSLSLLHIPENSLWKLHDTTITAHILFLS